MTASPLPEALRQPYARLCEHLRKFETLVVAYSGGVDSGLLAWLAHEVLGPRALAVIGVSNSLPARERAAAIAFLDTHRIPFEVIETDEMDDPRYRENNTRRCYFCKSELFGRLSMLATERGYTRIAYGASLDDRGDYRPGAEAAAELEVVSPLADVGFTKEMVRLLARSLGLELWDKPAAPCLASRIPYFSEVTPEKLAQVERAENVVKDLGFDVCRVRHRGELAMIEIPKEQHRRAGRDDVWRRLEDGIKAAGFERVALDPEGFRSGRLNDVLRDARVPSERG